MPPCRPVALAAELARLGAGVVVVGSTATLLRTGTGEPRDLDVAVRHDGVPALVEALECLGGAVSASSLRRCGGLRVSTAWGPLDVFVAAAVRWQVVRVADVEVRVLAEAPR